MDTGNDIGPRAIARASLLAGGVATLLASTCCLGPLVLVLPGFSGAWIGQLTALEPSRPVFVTAALLALARARRQSWKPPAACTGLRPPRRAPRPQGPVLAGRHPAGHRARLSLHRPLVRLKGASVKKLGLALLAGYPSTLIRPAAR